MKSTAQHPFLLTLFKQYTNEAQSFRKVHRMIDLFESIIKTHTVVILAEYVKHNKLSDSAKGLLAQGLRTPSLGTWQLFSRVLFEELHKDNYTWLIPDFAPEFTTLDKALNIDKTNVISFRNGYAHGATPSDLQCENDIKKFDPFLNLLLGLNWLNQSSMEVLDGRVYLVSSNEKISLHPMLLYRKEADEASFAFFNDLKNDKIGLLNYPLSKHYREKDFYTEFHEHLPLHEWKKAGNNEFYQRIEELTETFKGRTQERNKLLHFVLQNRKGYFSIQGNPGIGKSALIAQFFKDLRAHDETKNLHVIEYFIRRGTNQAQVEYLFNYLIRRTDEVFAAGKEIRAEGKMLFDLQNQLFSKWRLWGEQASGKQLLFLIDGLDEGVENNVVNYLPRENFENILIIYGSRPGGHKSIDDLWGQLPVLNHTKLELSGLSIEDIRALIYEVANKYELERESTWIDAVQKRSEGNPLYLKLLCDAIENGSIALNDIDALPKEIDEYYKAILQRYAYDAVDGDALLAGLFTFAAAKDYLTMGHLGLINKLGDATIQRIGSTLKEVLYENPLTEEVLDYQLFHESFREYLVKEKQKEVNDAAERIVDFCANWRELEGNWEQRYALEHYAAHLADSKKEMRADTLLQLLYDAPYANAQKKVLKNFDASNRLYRTILLKASGMQRFEEQLEAALCLVDLKYEEANDAPQVIELVANGEIDLALKRIESFGGEDLEGVRRKFILYMLCLMELTLLDSKNKPFRKAAIEKLLNHLDEQLPVDHSILNWNDFFPSYIVFLMACEWAELGLDYTIVYKRTASWEYDWIKDKGPYSEIQFQVIADNTVDIRAYPSISEVLARYGYFSESLDFAQCIDEVEKKCKTLAFISSELHFIGKDEEASSIMFEALSTANEIPTNFLRCFALSSISLEMTKQGRLEDALDCINNINISEVKNSAQKDISLDLANQGRVKEAYICAIKIPDESDKSNALTGIAIKLAYLGQIEESETVIKESLAIARSILGESDKIRAIMDIAVELAKQGQTDASTSVMEEALFCVSVVSDEFWKSSALNDIATGLAKLGQLEKALAFANCISDDEEKVSALNEILVELTKQGRLEDSLALSLKIDGEGERNNSLMDIAVELSKHGRQKDALYITHYISDQFMKITALMVIGGELTKLGQLQQANMFLQNALAIIPNLIDVEEKNTTLKAIAVEFAKQAQIIESLSTANQIRSPLIKDSALIGISILLAKHCHLEESLSCTREIVDKSYRIKALTAISSSLFKQGQKEQSVDLLDESLSSALIISDKIDGVNSLIDIAAELFKQEQTKKAETVMQKAFEYARGISDEYFKSIALQAISSKLANQSKIEKALKCANDISDEFYKRRALNSITTELAKQGKIEESLNFARIISNPYEKSRVLAFIAAKLAKEGKEEDSASVMQESLASASGIIDRTEKCRALNYIAIKLTKQGQHETSASVMKESITCARDITNERDNGFALKTIAFVLAKQGNWALAENTGLEIPQLAERHRCWKAIAEETFKEIGWQSSLEKLKKLKSDEARLFYLKGWAEALNQHEADAVCLQEALSNLVNDSESIENLLQKYALHEVFFGNASKEKLNRLNRTLNIQWALDIVANFPKETEAAYHSSNLETWIQEIEDENDREDILGWAEKVSLGKMTEEKFQERIQRLI